MYENFSNSIFNKLLVPFFMLAFLFTVLREARESDLIHAHWLPSALVGIAAKKLWKKPLVLTVHGKDVRTLPEFLVRFIVKNCDAVTTGHEDIAEFIEKKVPGSKVKIIRNMLDFESFTGKKDVSHLKKEFGLGNDTIAVYAARLVEWKDPLTFVEATPRVLSKDKSFKFFVLGDGELMEEVKEKVKELNLEKKVVVTGRRKDVSCFMQLGNMFAATSNLQNVFSVSLIEAMVSGLPCIITRAGDTERFFEHEKNCLLVQKENPKELAEAMLRLSKDRELARNLAANASVFLKKHGFDKKTILQENLELYTKLLKRDFEN
jgi:glycosyltransferase involved in cell wall biosynthesis